MEENKAKTTVKLCLLVLRSFHILQSVTNTPTTPAQKGGGRINVQVTIYSRLLIGRDRHLDQFEAYEISQLVREYGPPVQIYSGVYDNLSKLLFFLLSLDQVDNFV